MFKKILTLTLLILPLKLFAAEGLEIIVSIKPFYNLVAAITHEVQTPQLLLKGQASPHHYSLKPSEVQLLSKADLIFWGGPDLEVFLEKPLQNLQQEKQIKLSAIDKLILLPLREKHLMDAHDHHHGHDHHHHHHDSMTHDPHFWLHPQNALLMAKHINKVLCEKDAKNCAAYQKNLASFENKLETQIQSLTHQLAQLRDAKFLVLHDAYQYFEAFYRINSRGAIHIHPEIPLSAKRVQSIRNIIAKEKIQCIFGEPQFEVKILQQLSKQFNCKVGQLDPIGQDEDLGSQGYLKLQAKLAKALLECFSKGN